MKYSRIKEPGQKDYLASTAVVMSEVSKLIICLAVFCIEESKIHKLSVSKVLSDLFGKNSDSFKMMVPAALCRLVGSSTNGIQVTYQMKILTTALFSVWMLKKSLSRLKWLSLFLLTAGIGLVQLSADSKKAKPGEEKTGVQQFVGLIAVFIACILSGLAGVWSQRTASSKVTQDGLGELSHAKLSEA
ncbi:hypothetical protein HDU96_007153 [Phlyctochytrium bullatum]|nr:hypothetical protein HDU96_007153 [Phlyctochytrium bullatum]